MRTRELLFLTVTFIGGLGLFGSLPTLLLQDGEDMPGYTASAKPSLPFEATGPVATIDGVEIPAARYNLEVARMVKVTQGHVPESQHEFYKKQILHRLVDEHLLNMVVAEKKLTISEDELDEEFRELEARFPSKEQFELFKQRLGVDDAQLREDLRTQATHKKLLEQHYGVKVTAKEVKAHYKKNPDKFTLEAQVRASHILLKVNKDASAERVAEVEKKALWIATKARAKDANFAELARTYSEGPSASNGGDLGLFPRERMVKPFAEAAFALKPGMVSQPVRTQFGWHVIKVFEHQEASVQPFEEVEARLREMLYTQKLREAMSGLLKKLKEKHEIKYIEANIVDTPDTSR